MGKCMFQVAGAFAEFERGMIQARIIAGLARAVKAGKTLGRPPVEEQALDGARTMLAGGTGVVKTAKALGLGVGTVHKLKRST